MLRKFLVPILCGAALAGCMANNALGSSATADINVNNLARIAVGMSKEEVWLIMKMPYSQESFHLQTDQYDVWFYVTLPSALGQSQMVRANLTPVTFKNGYLVAVGNDYYRWLLKQEKMSSAPPPQEKQAPQEEDRDLERALDQPPAKSTSMSSRPKQNDSPPPAAESEEDDVQLDEKDRKMLEEDSEQNFDFW